jgi:tripartite-type tricarboxylate transporter receptor subunit TctC
LNIAMQKVLRMWFRRFAVALPALLAGTICGAQPYPVKPVRYVVTGSPGSSTDAFGRVMAEGLAQQFGRQFVVDNRTGAGSNIGPEIVAKSPADGYTLLQMTISHAVNVTLYKALAYDLLRDFAPVTQLVTDPAVLSVHPSLPVKSAAELIRLAKGRPDALSYSSGGTGTFTFLAAELFNGQAGVRMLHVPYKGGGPALTAVIAGEVPVYFAPLGVALPHLHSGRLRPLGVTTLKRLPLLPELPTVSESGLRGYESGNWFGLLVPAKTPREVVTALHAAAVAVLRNPAMIKRLNDMAYVPVGNTPEELGAHIRHEVERLGRIVRALNLAAD